MHAVWGTRERTRTIFGAKMPLRKVKLARTCDDAIRKIRGLAHTDQIMHPRKTPNLRIRGIPSDLGQRDDWKLGREP
jgi:hypothetical protein